jgi:hypothetical protein
MSTFSTYEVRDEQSGRLFFSGSLAACATQAALLAPAHPSRKFTIVPVGQSVTSSRPLTGPEPLGPVGGELPVVQAYT